MPGSRDYLKLGSWNVLCDRCGFKYKANELRREWNGLYTCTQCWEPRHPQDFLRAIPDDQSVPYVRPYGQDQFIDNTAPTPDIAPGILAYSTYRYNQDFYGHTFPLTVPIFLSTDIMQYRLQILSVTSDSELILDVNENKWMKIVDGPGLEEQQFQVNFPGSATLSGQSLIDPMSIKCGGFRMDCDGSFPDNFDGITFGIGGYDVDSALIGSLSLCYGQDGIAFKYRDSHFNLTTVMTNPLSIMDQAYDIAINIQDTVVKAYVNNIEVMSYDLKNSNNTITQASFSSIFKVENHSTDYWFDNLFADQRFSGGVNIDFFRASGRQIPFLSGNTLLGPLTVNTPTDPIPNGTPILEIISSDELTTYLSGTSLDVDNLQGMTFLFSESNVNAFPDNPRSVLFLSTGDGGQVPLAMNTTDPGNLQVRDAVSATGAVVNRFVGTFPNGWTKDLLRKSQLIAAIFPAAGEVQMYDLVGFWVTNKY